MVHLLSSELQQNFGGKTTLIDKMWTFYFDKKCMSLLSLVLQDAYFY